MKKTAAMILAVSAALLLTACGTGKETGKTGAGTASNSSAGSGTAQADNKEVDNQEEGKASDGSGSPSSGMATVDMPAEAEAAPDQGEASDTADVVSPEDTYDAMNQSGDDADFAAPKINWEGTYSSNSGETLTISVSDEYTVSFAFSVSGISGTADVEGNQGIYNGDDNVEVIFDHFDKSLEVTVLNSEGGVEESTISGTYSRQ